MEPTTQQQGAHPAAVDLDRGRRPGVPRERAPTPWPNAKFPPERQHGRPSVPKHGRPNKPMTPVYGTAVPLHGMSGLIRRAAYRYPDHYLRHWTMLLFADRVDSWTWRSRQVARLGVPVTAALLLAARAFGLGRR